VTVAKRSAPQSAAASSNDASPLPAPRTEAGGPLTLPRLHALRWIAIAVQVVLVVMAGRWFGGDVAIAPALAICALQAALNAASHWRLRRFGNLPDRELFFQLVVDAAALTGVAYFAGGSTNPIVTLYLPSIAIGATILPPRRAAALAIVAIACYSFVARVHRTIHIHDAQQAFEAHLFGMWLIFVISATLIAWFVVRMSQAIRLRDAELADAREAALRNDRVVALGNLAAGAAHELGTPLATMAVLAGELAQRTDTPEEARADAELIAMQVRECKRIISQLTTRAGSPRAADLAAVPFDDWLRSLLQRWHLQRPSAIVKLDVTGSSPAPRVMNDSALEQALLSLLNNAADASSQPVDVTVNWMPSNATRQAGSAHASAPNAVMLSIEIADRGPGIPPSLVPLLGREPVTTRGDGRGFGLMLARTAVERLGGSLHHDSRAGGGTIARLGLTAVTGNATGAASASALP